MNKFLFLLSLSLSLNAFSQSIDPDSAYRAPNIPYEVYEQRAWELLFKEKMPRITPLGKAKIYNEAEFDSPVSWKSMETLQDRFEKIRDERFLKSDEEFPRRSTWMYPDDGCYARAALANKNLFRWYAPVPNKVFAFGHLRVETENSPRGKVGWWYHVAPIVEVNEEKYVLDPAIEPSRPLTLHEWIGRMGKHEKIKVAICSSGTYSPRDNCEKETDGLERRAENAQMYFLKKEWARLERLGRNTEIELGEQPPWL